jgi:hypothetical protein
MYVCMYVELPNIGGRVCKHGKVCRYRSVCVLYMYVCMCTVYQAYVVSVCICIMYVCMCACVHVSYTSPHMHVFVTSRNCIRDYSQRYISTYACMHVFEQKKYANVYVPTYACVCMSVYLHKKTIPIQNKHEGM